MGEDNLEISSENIETGVQPVNVDDSNKKTELEDKKLQAKFDLWERKLLDLSTRNPLLNLRIKGSCVPVFVPDCANIEDLLAQKKDFQINSRGKDDEADKSEEAEIKEVTQEGDFTDGVNPVESTEKTQESEQNAETINKNTKNIGIPVKDYSIIDLCETEAFRDYLDKGLQKGVLYSSLTDAALDKNIKKMYRGAKLSIEENGANTLFLACGFLKWFDIGKKDPCYAPILLIPVELVRKVGRLGYTMRKRDEDVQFNVTVSEKLRQDFKIEFDLFSKELPADDNGVDVKTVFEEVSKAVSVFNDKGWEVIGSCVLGLFSFSQFVMWNDMHSHRIDIKKNKIVKSLINGALDWESEEISQFGRLSEEDVFLPISADSSQLAAIKYAVKDDSSFVLHGPPGTGKSQTITSMIANCLANGKKVLFAAEKKAALDVVYKRLEKIGISPFCLELHSNKVRKSYVLEQLRVACEIEKPDEAGADYAKALADITAKRRELDAYVDALHKRYDNGFTLYELINVYSDSKDAHKYVSLDEGFAENLTYEKIKATESALGELAVSNDKIEGKLLFVKTTDFSQDAKNKLPSLVEEFIRAYDDFAASVAAFDKLLTDNSCRIAGESGTIGRIAGLNYAGTSIAKLRSLNLPKGLICCDDTESAYLSLRDAVYACKDALAKKAALCNDWQDGFLDLDGAALLSELMTAKAKNALVRGMAEGNVYKKVKAYDKGNHKETLEQAFKLLTEYKNSVQNATNYITSVRGYLGELYNPGAAFPGFDISYVESLNENAHAAFAEFTAFDPTGMVRKLVGNGDAFLSDAVNSFNSKTTSYSTAYTELKNTYGFEYGAFEPAEDPLESKKQMVQDLLANSDSLRDRILFNMMLAKCKEYKVSYSDDDNRQTDQDEVVKSFKKEYSALLISQIIDNEDVLRTFSGLVFEKKISELKRLSEKFEKITREEIYLRIRAHRRDIVKDANVKSAAGILQHAIKSGGRGISIRTLFSQIGDLIFDICPCVLMSPLSCAQYLDSDAEKTKFDVVIFDEASQLPTCKAVGVIARGNNAIVVGDPKQMPPTAFFSTQVSEEDANFEVDDLESILDDCLAINMPQLYLSWHYRSRHESLITFSNKSFYDGRLYTFPSPDDRQSKVTMVECGGTFDSGKTRTNKAEAQAVIDEIVKRAKDPVLSKYSVGVVTFNIQQQSLIEDLLDEAASKDPELEKWAFGSEEPIFVKNLENVQGDERDVILFSVGYGKDETGKLIMNFGPLNRDGGWRRLNVAVTRSRIEMKVFSSISPEEIRINETASEGVKAFKRFLQYAGGSTLWDQDITSTGSSSDNAGTPLIDRNAAFTGIADDICARFKAAGYDTDKGVGKSGFKIDIGVISPDKEGTYCLGILLDGPVYKSAGTTSSREISQISVLNGFGWNVVRVWSLEWWENPDKEFNKLIDLIENKKSESSSDSENIVENPPSSEEDDNAAELSEEPKPEPEIFIYNAGEETESEESDDQIQKKNESVDIRSLSSSPAIVYKAAEVPVKQMTSKEFCEEGRNNAELQKNIGMIVEQESPISSNQLAIRLVSLAGIEKMTPSLQKRCSYLMKSLISSSLSKINMLSTSQMLDPESEEGEVVFLWKEGSEINKVMDFYRVPAEGEKPRKAYDIPVQEAACAANYLAVSQYGMPYASLITETCKALGLTRAPEDSDNYRLGKRAVDYCIRQGLLQMDDDGFVKMV